MDLHELPTNWFWWMALLITLCDLRFYLHYFYESDLELTFLRAFMFNGLLCGPVFVIIFGKLVEIDKEISDWFLIGPKFAIWTAKLR